MQQKIRVSHCHWLCVVMASTFLSAAVAQEGVAAWARVDATGQQTHHAQMQAAAVVGPVPEGFENLPLAPGILVQMDIYGIPEMSMQLRINERGDVAIPLVGAVRVAGQTVTRAQDTIAKLLADRDILKDPQVTLNLVQFPASNISVLGEVQMPGRIQLLVPQPLSDVLALAGGETIAAGNDIEIETAQNATRHIRFTHGSDTSVLRSTWVAPGDTVMVGRAGIIYVLGAVNRSGGYLMANGGSLDVVQALSLAGGETMQASPRWALIVRRKSDQVEQIRIPLREMEKGKVPAAELQVNDALYIPSSGWKSVVMNGSNVLSAAAAASIYAASNRP